MMRAITIVLTLLFILTFSIEGYGESRFDLKKIYGLRERDRLHEIIQEVEKSNSSNQENLKLLGIAYHNLGVLEVKGAPPRAVEYLEKAIQLSPEDYEVMVYLGSSKTMIARDSWNVVTKVSRANQGLRMIDKAVSKSPDNPVVRMVRANNSLKLPKMFNRRGVALKDFLHLEVLIEKSPDDFPPEVKAEVFYQLGMLHKEKEESRAQGYFKKAMDVAPDSVWGKKAQDEL